MRIQILYTLVAVAVVGYTQAGLEKNQSFEILLKKLTQHVHHVKE
jgi:hypothetical protein